MKEVHQRGNNTLSATLLRSFPLSPDRRMVQFPHDDLYLEQYLLDQL